MNPEGDTPEAKGPYVRTLKDLDSSSEVDKQRVFEMIGVVLNDLSIRVKVDGDGDLDESSDTAAFITELRARTNLHFFRGCGCLMCAHCHLSPGDAVKDVAI